GREVELWTSSTSLAGRGSAGRTAKRLTRRTRPSNVRRMIDTALVLRILHSARGKALSVDDVLVRGRFDAGEKPALRRALRALVSEGKLEQEGRRYLVPGEEPPKKKPRDKGAEVVSEVVPFARPLVRPE